MDQLPYLSKTFPKSPSIVRCQVLRFLPIWPTFLKRFLRDSLASQVVLVVKNPPASAGDVRDLSSISGLGRSLGAENGNPPLYPCLENSTDRGAWWAAFHGAAESQTRLCPHTHTKSLLVQWLKLPTPKGGGLSSIPGQGTRSYTWQLTLSAAKQMNKQSPQSL